MPPRETRRTQLALRQKFWIDRNVQGVLVGRVIIYWVFGLAYLGIGSACFEYYQNPSASLGEHAWSLASQFGPWLPTLLFIMPLVVYDVIRLSNAFAGPVYRLRMNLQLLADREPVRPMVLRPDDYWQDLSPAFNEVREELVLLREEVEGYRARARFLAEAKPDNSESDGESTAAETSDLDAPASLARSMSETETSEDPTPQLVGTASE